MTDLTPDLTPKKGWVPAFLAGLAEYGNVSKAAKRAKVSRAVVYEARSDDDQFAAAWDVALKQGTEALEDEARRRAFEGVRREKGIYHKGVMVGKEVIREYSDTLMIFLLKAHKPELYRETSRVLTINVTPDDLRNMSDDDLADLERKLAN